MAKITIIKHGTTPHRPGSDLALAWDIAQQYDGRDDHDCIAAITRAGLKRRPSSGDPKFSNRGYLRQFHREGLLVLESYVHKPKAQR